MPPLRLDSTTSIKQSLEISPTRSSVHSSRAHTPSSSVPSTPVIPTRPPSPEKKSLHPGDSNPFLTALAAQERRVLELKEELQKAEGDLEKLKKQWATREATKKRNELRHLEQLQPLKIPLGGSDSDRKITGRDLDQRKIAPSMVKSSRTVFSGSKHTRALSLLSPKDSTVGGSHLPSPSHVPPKCYGFSINEDTIPNTIQESSNSTDGPSDSGALYQNPPKDMILETGKQLVGELRHGLWTFLEDLRQVTVGDEAASTSDLRNQHPMLSGNMPKSQAKTERVLGLRRVPARKVGISSLEIVQNQPSQPRNSVHTKETNPISAETDMIADVVPPSLLATQTRTINANSNSSDSDDDDGWDDWDTVTTKGSNTRSKKGTSAANILSSPLTDESSP